MEKVLGANVVTYLNIDSAVSGIYIYIIALSLKRVLLTTSI